MDTMPAMTLSTTPSIDTPRPPPASDAASRKARFWDRIARKYATDPIADLPGYEATLRRVQGLLTAEMDVLEIGCGTGSTALRLAPFTRRLLATDVSSEMIAIAARSWRPSRSRSWALRWPTPMRRWPGWARSTRCWRSTCCIWSAISTRRWTRRQRC